MLRIGIGTCTCRYFLLQYLVLEVSVKIGIGAALPKSYINSLNLYRGIAKIHKSFPANSELSLQPQQRFSALNVLPWYFLTSKLYSWNFVKCQEN